MRTNNFSEDPGDLDRDVVDLLARAGPPPEEVTVLLFSPRSHQILRSVAEWNEQWRAHLDNSYYFRTDVADEIFEFQWHRSHLHSGLPISDKQIGEMQITEDSSSSPFKVYERNESVRCFYNAFVKLPETYQAVIRLRDLEQRSISETARFLHLSVPAVKTRHRRARHLMVRFLPPTKIKFTARQ